METRKVQLAGNSTYTVSIPKGWAREQGIETGQPVRLCPRTDGQLILEAGHEDPRRPVADVTDASPEEVRLTVRALYTLGYEEFGVSSETDLSSTARNAVTETAARLTGLEVTTETEREIRCRDLLDTAEVSIERVVSRLEFAALSAHRKATTALAEADRTRIAEVEGHRRDATAEFAVVERCFQRTFTDVAVLDHFGGDRRLLLHRLRVAEALDRVAAVATDLASLPAPDDASPSADWLGEFADRAQQTRLLVERSTTAALSDTTVAEVYDVQRDVERCAEAVRAVRTDLTVPAPERHLLAVQYLERTVECGSTIASCALQSALQREA